MDRVFEALGGRKFIGLLLLSLAGGLVEVYGKAGLSATMAGFLAGLYATYAATNAVLTHKEIDSAVAEPTAVVTQVPNEETQKLTEQIALTLGQINGALNSLNAGQSRSEQALNSLQQAVVPLQKAVGALLASRQDAL